MEPLITIASFSSAHQAHHARTFLQEHGVECFLADEHLDAVYVVPGGVRLRVLASQEEKARALIAQHDKALFEDDPDIDWESVDPTWGGVEEDVEASRRCPKCQSANAHHETLSGGMILLSLALLGIPLLFLPRTSVCAQCGHRWKP